MKPWRHWPVGMVCRLRLSTDTRLVVVLDQTESGGVSAASLRGADEGFYRMSLRPASDILSPAFDYPATEGALLGVIRAHFGCYAWISFAGAAGFAVWLSEGTGDRVVGRGETVEAALCDALEVVP